MTRTLLKSLAIVAVLCAALRADPVSAQTTQQLDYRLNRAVLEANEAMKAAAERQQPLKFSATGNRSLSGLSAVLVSGDLQASAGGSGDDIPAAARKALADMKDFLPYKSYRLLDAAWFVGGGDSNGQLRGVDGRMYSLRLKSTGMARLNQPSVGLSVELEELAGSAGSKQPLEEIAERSLRSLQEKQLELQKERAALREKYLEGHPLVVAVNMKIAETMRQLEQAEASRSDVNRVNATERPIIDTSFTMNIGETVIVGTSRVNGDKALILLLTAVPK